MFLNFFFCHAIKLAYREFKRSIILVNFHQFQFVLLRKRVCQTPIAAILELLTLESILEITLSI